MAQQKQKQKKKKKKKKITVNPRNYLRENKKTVSPKETKLRKQIVKLRGEGKTWEEVCDELDTYPVKAKKIYDEEIALGTVANKRAASHFSKYIDAMDERYGEIVGTMDRLHDMAKKVMDDFEGEDLDDMRTYVKFMKSAPTIIKIVREIKDQIEFLREEQERIKVEQKNYIYSPTQINKQLTTTLHYLNKNEYIKILKRLPFDK